MDQKQKRIMLHEKLCRLLGSRDVYFQPPETLKMNYPCIVYRRTNARTTYGDNKVYNFNQAYDLYYIDQNPDSNMIEKILKSFTKISYSRHYAQDNLNHDVFLLYF